MMAWFAADEIGLTPRPIRGGKTTAGWNYDPIPLSSSCAIDLCHALQLIGDGRRLAILLPGHRFDIVEPEDRAVLGRRVVLDQPTRLGQQRIEFRLAQWCDLLGQPYILVNLRFFLHPEDRQAYAWQPE